MSTSFLPEKMSALVHDSKSSIKDQLWMSWKHDRSISSPGTNEVTVKVKSASLNPLDYRVGESTALLMTLNNHPVGTDFAGEIVALGHNVERNHQFRVGDKVFGWGNGLAEFANVHVGRIAKIPTGLDVREMAMYPCVGVTAYQILNKYWFSRADYQVRALLIIGASGGVGSCLIQMARAHAGPEVRIYGICSGPNLEYCKKLGANEVFDYTKSNFNATNILPDQSVDIVVDLISGTPEGPNYVESVASRIMNPNGTYVTTNTLSKLEMASSWFSAMTGIQFRNSHYQFFVVGRDDCTDDLLEIASYISQGKLKLEAQEELPFDEMRIRAAYHKLKERHMRGKFLVNVESTSGGMSQPSAAGQQGLHAQKGSQMGAGRTQSCQGTQSAPQMAGGYGTGQYTQSSSH